LDIKPYSQGIEKANFSTYECCPKNSLLNLRGNGKQRWELFRNYFFSGGIVHLIQKKRAQFKQATEAGPIFGSFVFQAFMSAYFIT